MGAVVTAPAREVLTVFFDGDERPGVTFYAVTTPDRIPARSNHTSPMTDAVHRFRLAGEGWEIVGYDLVLDGWPRDPEWIEFVRAWLEDLVRQGAVAAWLGADGYVVAVPPNLFDPRAMSGAVLAYCTADGKFSCPTTPDLPVRPVDNDELLELRACARGLADLGS